MSTKMKKISLISVVLLLFIGLICDSAHAQLPDDFPELVITKTEDAAPGDFIGTLGMKGGYRVVLDNTGYPVYYSKDQNYLSKLVLPNGLIAVQARGQDFLLKDESFTVVDSFAGTNGRCFVMLSNGNAIVGAGDTRQIDMSQVVDGGRPDAAVKGASFLEMDANKQVVFEWNCLDYMPLTETLVDLTAKNIDFTHLNYVNIDPIDHNYLLSIRHSCSILKVSRTTGEIIWRLGGPANDFEFIGEDEDNAPYYFRAQHSVHRLANGNILFFDNGGAGRNAIDVPERTYSRAVEYHLDEVNMTATLVWEYRKDPDVYAQSQGDVQRLDNGNTVINWGAAVRNGAPIATEVTPAGEIAFEMSFANQDEAIAPCNILKHRWNSPDLVTSQTYSNIEAGQTYDSPETGVSVTVNSLTASAEYNGLVVKKHDVAVRFPRFSGKAPWVLEKRVTLAGFGITPSTVEPRSYGFLHLNEVATQKRAGTPQNIVASYKRPGNPQKGDATSSNPWLLTLDATFDIQELDADKADQLTVYHRPNVGQGEFTALATTFDDINGTLTVTNASLGEYVFGYPDTPEIPLQPILHGPENFEMVNQTKPVSLQWAPRGFARSYRVQVATDARFSKKIVDESGLRQTGYELASVDPDTTYYWRVNTTNYGGTSEWATQSFSTVPAMVEVVTPNGGESFIRYSDVYIIWDDNIAEDVVIELYKEDVFVSTIGTVPSIGAYEWEVDGDGTLEPGSDYTIKIKSSLTDSIIDTSDAPFSIVSP